MVLIASEFDFQNRCLVNHRSRCLRFYIFIKNLQCLRNTIVPMPSIYKGYLISKASGIESLYEVNFYRLWWFVRGMVCSHPWDFNWWLGVFRGLKAITFATQHLSSQSSLHYPICFSVFNAWSCNQPWNIALGKHSLRKIY